MSTSIASLSENKALSGATTVTAKITEYKPGKRHVNSHLIQNVTELMS